MKNSVKVKYGLNEIIEEMGGENTEDILVLKAKDRFFVGNGCETPYTREMPSDLSTKRKFLLHSFQASKKNVSICSPD